ncbi:T9SS type A sorting domain-containing protein [Flavobacterium microcysteis]|uniref:T9SS type A sorting domain-containing protein n=1 Tax=Flavobacterium microcysteis TaxID=2596891 RepID=A0A501QFZ0_9FLAO|nr:T9SS type A sorting domain-containing protein [Flavobacterium microcysteis]TPD71809.1 T9SS type A sorting domain-containing protein [Flavobacterium microcysteis]
MKKIQTLLLALASTTLWAQQTISFETSEGYQPGTLHQQNGWEVTEGSDGYIANQTVSNEAASTGSYSFKNAYEPSFDWQYFPIFGASKIFDSPKSYNNFTISYDVMASAKLGSDFEFTLFAIDSNEEYVPVAGVGIENRGFIYLIKNVDYGFDYAVTEWAPNQWVNIKIEVTASEIKYYINNTLEKTIANYTELNIVGFNMLHNNYGNNAFYDNFVITSENLGTKPFEAISYSVYPNPAQDIVSIELPANTTLSGASIYNIAGQKVMQTEASQTINVSSLSAGTYFLKGLTTDGASFTKKLIKK